MSFDLWIHGGTIVDGSGSPPFTGDVGITGTNIEYVGKPLPAETAARSRLDAAGRFVAPGFIDVHNHSDGWMLKKTHQPSKTFQGITTEVLMADGISYAPVSPQTAADWVFYLRALDGLRMDEYRGWETLADFAGELDRANVQNSMLHVPYANVRSLACGWGRQGVDDFQMRSIRAMIRAGMESGAVGLSTGLDYIVQCFSTTSELIEACRVVAEYGGLYVTHMRYKNGLLPALREAVEIARVSGVKLHISHLKAQSPGETEQVFELLEQAGREIELSFDVYPYQSGSTLINYLLPYETWEEGPLAALGRLRDPDIRARMERGIREYRLPTESIRLAWLPGKENSHWQGRLLSEYLEHVGGNTADALFHLLVEERLSVLGVMNEGDDHLVEPFLQHDRFVLGTDGIFAEGGCIHPRQYGSVGRMLGSLVRERQLFTVEQAVHSMTGRTAARFGIPNRGLLQSGTVADVVVFDPATVADRATYLDPHQTTTGIDDVIVGGTAIIRDGQMVDVEQPPGRFLAADFGR